MLESDDNHLRRCHANSDSLRAYITYITFLNIGRDKSLVDDLNMGQGIVSRGACLPCDPLRFSPCPEDLLQPQHLSPHPQHTPPLLLITSLPPLHTHHFTTAAQPLPGACLPHAPMSRTTHMLLAACLLPVCLCVLRSINTEAIPILIYFPHCPCDQLLITDTSSR